MKSRKAIYVLLILSIIFTFIGGTFAYFRGAAISNNSNVTANSKEFDVVYHAG